MNINPTGLYTLVSQLPQRTRFKIQCRSWPDVHSLSEVRSAADADDAGAFPVSGTTGLIYVYSRTNDSAACRRSFPRSHISPCSLDRTLSRQSRTQQ